ALPEALASTVFALEAEQSLTRLWAEMVRQAGRDAQAGQVEEMGARLLNSIDKGSDLVRFLSVLLDQPGRDPTWRVNSLAERGTKHQDAGRLDLALGDYEQAIQLRPDHARTIAWRGGAFQQLGRYEEALADLTRAIELDPKYARAIASRAL